MPRTNDSIDLRIISKVSSLYYNQGYNQQAIAKRLHLSRPKVSRLLKQAREQGIVQISIISPNNDFVDLEESIEEKYGLQEVLIIDTDLEGTPMPAKILKKQLGSAAANYLQRTAQKGDIIGVSWGTTLQAMVDAMHPKPIDDLHIVQALGGVGPAEAKAHAADISRRLSQLLGARLTLLPTPGIVSSSQAKEVLMADRKVKKVIDLFAKIDTLYAGLGSLQTNPIFDEEANEIPPKIYKQIEQKGAIGDIALRFFDKDGTKIDSKLQDLIIGITLKEIKKVNTVVGIAGGPQKKEVIQGALKGGYLNVLITDNQTASALLE